MPKRSHYLKRSLGVGFNINRRVTFSHVNTHNDIHIYLHIYVLIQEPTAVKSIKYIDLCSPPPPLPNTECWHAPGPVASKCLTLQMQCQPFQTNLDTNAHSCYKTQNKITQSISHHLDQPLLVNQLDYIRFTTRSYGKSCNFIFSSYYQ